MSTLKVLFVLGGRSGEHEISLISGKHILAALDRKVFEPIVLIIQKSGSMTLSSEAALSKLPNNPKEVKTPSGEVVSLRPFYHGAEKPCLVVGNTRVEFDVAFPVLHGPGGEDGTIQGLFELAEIPVVGCSTKSSAICMDKGMTKRLCQLAGLPVVPFVEAYKGEDTPKIDWPYPVFVKPATLGSSLGVSKIKKPEDLQKALHEAFALDQKVLIEPAIEGREIEIAVYGSRKNLVASPAGEIKVTKAEFYSYDAKYVNVDAAELILPTTLPADALARVQEIAKNIFKTLECKGMARIDFFMTAKNEFLLNEVNTIPGFTPISMYPKLMDLAGIPYAKLLSGLIELAQKETA